MDNTKTTVRLRTHLRMDGAHRINPAPAVKVLYVTLKALAARSWKVGWKGHGSWLLQLFSSNYLYSRIEYMYIYIYMYVCNVM